FLFSSRRRHTRSKRDCSSDVCSSDLTAGTKNSVYLYSEPIDVSTLLSETFFDRKESVVLTSATLTIDRSFTFIANRLGLTNKRLMTKKIQSPFSYKNQVQLMVPNDFPDIKKASTDEFVYATC